jgi:beta-galactosidase
MNKSTCLLFAALLLFAFVFQIEAQKSGRPGPRISYLINDNWRFSAADDASYAGTDLRDAAWEKVNIPHTWNIKDTFDDEPGYRRGGGWYRRVLKLGPELSGKRIFLYFEGVNQVADVYVNGQKAGQHTGGYTAFSFDITNLVKFNAPNIIAVRADNSFNEDIPPLTADFNFYGGIYRNVRLIAADPVHIKITDGASDIQISTPEISGVRDTVTISGVIENASEIERDIEVVNMVVDAAGRGVGTSSSNMRVRPKSDSVFIDLITPVANPKLWSPDDPYLYTVRTEIRENGKILDRVTSPLGFRSFSFDGQKGFSLNGKPLKLRGTNRHQDYAGLGNAVPDALQVKDMELIKDAGFNFVRLAHYPQSPAVLAAADRLGLMIWEEIPIVNYITLSPAFTQNSEQMLIEMIRQHRNHPSVIMWGYMNEIFLRPPPNVSADKLHAETVSLARRLNVLARLEDPARPTTIAFHGSEVYNTTRLGEGVGITGWNLYSGWYSKTFDDFGKFIDDQHARYPNRPLIISEYGANGDRRLHSTSPRRFDSTIEYQRMFHESYLAQINARPYIAGTAIWNEFDFAAEQRGETIPHLNQKGMFTYDRKPKDIHYFYKANYSASPVLHIAVRDWARRAGVDRTPARIDVYSNLAEVELLHNGVSLGKKGPNELRKITWEAVLREGKNTFTAKGTSAKMAVTDSATVDYTAVTANSPQIAVNVGSNAQFIDENHVVWLADQAYKQGSWGFVGEEIKTIFSEPPDRNVMGTLDDPLFQTMQENLNAYRFDVPAGEYQVDLLFAEMKFDKPGERIFDAKVNGKLVLEKLDLVKQVGARQAFIQQCRISSTGGINIEFSAVKGKPILSGVRLKRLN